MLDILHEMYMELSDAEQCMVSCFIIWLIAKFFNKPKLDIFFNILAIILGFIVAYEKLGTVGIGIMIAYAALIFLVTGFFQQALTKKIIVASVFVMFVGLCMADFL